MDTGFIYNRFHQGQADKSDAFGKGAARAGDCWPGQGGGFSSLRPQANPGDSSMPAKKTATSRIILRTDSTDITLRLPAGTVLQQAAMQWSHIVRNRKRWAPGETSVAQQEKRARELLQKTLGLSESDRETIAASTAVEVCMGFASEKQQWEARVLPWEYLLTAGTTDLRKAPLTVLRRLERPGVVPLLPKKPKVLYVESAPGRIKEAYDFAEEEQLVRANTNATSKSFVKLGTPTRAELEAAIKKVKPDIVHLAGVDTHQGLTLLGDASAPNAQDGYLLRGSRRHGRRGRRRKPGDAVRRRSPGTGRVQPVEFGGPHLGYARRHGARGSRARLPGFIR